MFLHLILLYRKNLRIHNFTDPVFETDYFAKVNMYKEVIINETFAICFNVAERVFI